MVETEKRGSEGRERKGGGEHMCMFKTLTGLGESHWVPGPCNCKVCFHHQEWGLASGSDFRLWLPLDCNACWFFTNKQAQTQSKPFMLTSKQAIRLQTSKPGAGGRCEVGQNSVASQRKKKLREKGKKVPLSSLAPPQSTWKSQQLFHRSCVYPCISKLLECNWHCLRQAVKDSLLCSTPEYNFSKQGACGPSSFWNTWGFRPQPQDMRP